MARIKIVKWNWSEFEAIRRSGNVTAMVDTVAARIATEAGPGYAWSGRQGRKGPAPAWNKKRGKGYQGRYRAVVYPATFRARRSNAKHNTLVKLIGRSKW